VLGAGEQVQRHSAVRIRVGAKKSPVPVKESG
jgi:hypothetical protein